MAIACFNHIVPGGVVTEAKVDEESSTIFIARQIIQLINKPKQDVDDASVSSFLSVL